MPLYALLLRNEDRFDAGLPPEEQAALFGRFVAWVDDLSRQGKLRGVERLTMDGASVVRKRDSRIVVDGPFAEGKEGVLGFLLVEAADHREAEEIAAASSFLDVGGSIEVRAVGPFPKPA